MPRTGYGAQSLITTALVVSCTATESVSPSNDDPSAAPTNQLPTVTISSPKTNSVFSIGDTIAFAGSASDPEDGVIPVDALEWASSIDGDLGTGSPLRIGNLSRSIHVITLIATDSDGAKDTASVAISINGLPSAAILSPNDSSIFDLGDSIAFQGEASDPEDGALPDSTMTWWSDLDGLIGSGRFFQRSDLSGGRHKLSLVVTDSDAASDTASSYFYLNRPPTASIRSPTSGERFFEGDTVTFSGLGTDAEDGTLHDSLLTWRSDVDGSLGEGSSLPVASLSVASHLVALTVTDSRGLKDVDVVSIEIQGPKPMISTPAPGATFTELADPVTFTGSATDLQDGPLQSSALTWLSDRDGQIGTGSSLTSSDLSLGLHDITLRATDSDGNIGTVTISVTITQMWEPVTHSVQESFQDVWANSSNNVFIVGGGGKEVYHFDGFNLKAQTFTGTGEVLVDVWGADPNNVFAVDAFNGTTMRTKDGGNTWTKHETFICCAVPSGPKYGVWGLDANHVWTVDKFGGVYRTDDGGDTWSADQTPTSEELLGIWGSGANDIFAVGDQGTIIHYDGSLWSLQTSKTSETLNGIWGSGPNDVFAAGNNGTILHYDGTSWSQQTSGTTQNLRTVGGTGPKDVFAAGNTLNVATGVILYYDGDRWRTFSNSAGGHRGLWALPNKEVFVVGSFGSILRGTR